MGSSLNGPLRWGFFGAGKITSDFVTVLGTLPKTKHVPFGIAARDPQRAKVFADSHKIQKTFETYQHLVDDPEVDVVYIGTVNSEHYSQAKLAIEHNKHVLIEKPGCVNQKQCLDLVESAKRKGVFLMEGFWTNCFPAARRFFSEIKNGAIGEVVLMTLEVGRGGEFCRQDRFQLRELCGGIMLNHGVYGLMFANILLGGLPDVISAVGHLNSAGLDETLTVTMSNTKMGATANVICSSRSNLPCELRVMGTTGMAKLPFPFWAPQQCELPSGTTTHELPVCDGLAKDHEFNYPFATGYVYEIDEVARCIREGLLESPLMPWDASIGVMKIADEARRQIGVVFPQDQEE